MQKVIWDASTRSNKINIHTEYSYLVHKSYFCTCEFELRANLASVQALDRSISSRKNGSASLQEHDETVQRQTQHRAHEYERQMRFILQSGELFTQKLNDHSAEHKAGEDGEQTSDTWTQNTINTF